MKELLLIGESGFLGKELKKELIKAKITTYLVFQKTYRANIILI